MRESAPRDGKVYLIGAGPGDPGLITVKGVECLRRAQVVAYDRLTHPSLLGHVSADCLRVYVGKASSDHAIPQEEITQALVDWALEGNTVCRLKGGDPFVFGRGGEEAEACAKAGVPFEVVPGVTSAIAALTYAGIPITHRDLSANFAVVTGHRRGDGSDAKAAQAQPTDWAALAKSAQTLVVLMGVETLIETTTALLEGGRNPEEPAALVAWGSWPNQRVLSSTLHEIAAEARRLNWKPPAILVVGRVVEMRKKLRWFDNRPLFGQRIVVTRAREQASELSERLRQLGADPVEFPAIRIQPIQDTGQIDNELQELSSFDWVIFTSANAVRQVWTRVLACRLDARAFAKIKLAAIGPATASELSEHGLIADFVPSRFVAEAVLEEWPDTNMDGKRVLIPRAAEARDVLPKGLSDRGAVVSILPVYTTEVDCEGLEAIQQSLAEGTIHGITFTSSSTVRNFMDSVGVDLVRSSNACCVSIGPITSQTLRDYGFEPTIEAVEHTIPGLVHALMGWYEGEAHR